MKKRKVGKLYIIATPIGNLKDITLRALDKLKKVDLILCEDTRVASKLLNYYNIKKPLLSYHHHSKKKRREEIIQKIYAGSSVALITDAGTPGLADPGNKLVDKIYQEKIKIEPLPGSSALTTIISVAGINLQQFVFLGFIPHKKGREKLFLEILEMVKKRPVIFYESRYRLLKTLERLQKEKINIIIGKELTKMYEEIKRGTSQEIYNYYQNHSEKIKGEFTLIVYKSE